MNDYTGMFEKVAGTVVGYSYEDTHIVKEASITPRVSPRLQLKQNLLNRELKHKIDMDAMSASMKYNTLAPRSSHLKSISVGAAQKAKPTGFFANTFRKVFGK